MNWSDVDRNPGDRKVRQFAAIWFAVLAAFAAWRWRESGASPAVVTMAVLAIAGGLVGTASPSLFRPVFVGLTVLTFPIGWVVSRLILAVVFYGVVTPIGLVLRLLGRDALGLRSKKDSYWTDRGKRTRPVASYLRQF